MFRTRDQHNDSIKEFIDLLSSFILTPNVLFGLCNSGFKFGPNQIRDVQTKHLTEHTVVRPDRDYKKSRSVSLAPASKQLL